MVITSFIIASLSVILLLLVVMGFNRATYRRGRRKMLRELSDFLDDVESTDPDRVTGTWRGMPVRIDVNEHAIAYEVVLPFAVIAHETLVARFASAELMTRMRRLELRVVDDRLVGRVAR